MSVDTKLTLFVTAVALLNVVVVLDFVRRRRLAENFALLWIGVGLAGIVLSIGRHEVDDLARKLGVYFGTSLVFALGILFLLFVSMSLSMHVTRLHAQTEVLAEEVAVLRGLLDEAGVTAAATSTRAATGAEVEPPAIPPVSP